MICTPRIAKLGLSVRRTSTDVLTMSGGWRWQRSPQSAQKHGHAPKIRKPLRKSSVPSARSARVFNVRFSVICIAHAFPRAVCCLLMCFFAPIVLVFAHLSPFTFPQFFAFSHARALGHRFSRSLHASTMRRSVLRSGKLLFCASFYTYDKARVPFVAIQSRFDFSFIFYVDAASCRRCL